ncbi:MFS transporter [Paenibacillus eucommiae]|uniref:EmrB/QacA subfamily drug resistance transporter n=1 Tax=Paenibacillus eucommiae TaxID=1355755 RepID=A0ABS4IN14_9BACL|nr:MFS transporter [Paenibacillus eucommiae]MBP1988555.1 EmrB/QacA subfamily drug resistance transporter [Paenibacillus eucommiae]
MYTNRWRILHIVNLGTFVSTLDIGIVNVALPTMAEQFSVSLAQIQWVVTCYLLTMVALLPLMGKLSDQVGRNKIYSGGFLVFGLGSLVAALSGSLTWIIIARCIQGVGATMIMANSQAMVRQIFPDNERGKALGLNAVIISVGTLAGPAVGGILMVYTGWEGLFLINVPLGILGLVAGLRMFPNIKQAASKGLDVIGIVALAAATVLLVLAAEGGVDVRQVWLLTGSGVALLAGLIYYETRISNGILDKELFTNRTIAIGNTSAFFFHLVQMATLIPITFYLQYKLGYEPWLTGLMLSLQPLFMGIVAPISGWYRDRFGAFALLVAGPVIGAASLVVVVVLPIGSAVAIAVHLALFGAAMGFFQATNNAEIMSAAPEHKISHTGSMLALIRYLGMIAGIGLAAAFVGNLGGADGPTPADSQLRYLFLLCFVFCLVILGASMLRRPGKVSPVNSSKGSAAGRKG